MEWVTASCVTCIRYRVSERLPRLGWWARNTGPPPMGTLPSPTTVQMVPTTPAQCQEARCQREANRRMTTRIDAWLMSPSIPGLLRLQHGSVHTQTSCTTSLGMALVSVIPSGECDLQESRQSRRLPGSTTTSRNCEALSHFLYFGVHLRVWCTFQNPMAGRSRHASLNGFPRRRKRSRPQATPPRTIGTNSHHAYRVRGRPTA